MYSARKTTLFREVNERIDELLHTYGADEEAEFLCECPAADCARLLPLRRSEFERIRATGAFVVAPECSRWVTAIERTAEYVVVGEFRPPLAVVIKEATSAAASRPARAGATALPARSALRAVPAPPGLPEPPGPWARWGGPSAGRSGDRNRPAAAG
jgi:hypothetical protein